MSFMRLYLQPQPRPILSEKFSIQQTPTPAFFVIPPRVSNFTMYVYCPASCLSRWNEPKTVFSALLHTHLLGRAVRTRVIRRGVEQPSEFIDEHYDFNYQNNIIAQKPLVINPGDDLILECVYDSSSQSRPTYGGLGTHQEMCLSIMDIYPKGARSSESCSGLLSPDEFLGLFNLSTSNIVSNGAASDTLANFNMNLTTSRGPTTYLDYMNNINWTPQLVRRIQNFVQNSGRPIQCDINPPGVNAQELTSNQTMMMVDPVRVTQPWRPTQLQCPRNSG